MSPLRSHWPSAPPATGPVVPALSSSAGSVGSRPALRHSTVTGVPTVSLAKPAGPVTWISGSGLVVASGVLPKAPWSMRAPLGSGSSR